MRLPRSIGSLPLATTIAMLGACGSSDGNGDEADAGSIDISGLTYNECDAADRIGGFTAELHADFSSTGGKVTDSVSPIGLLETITESGPCRHAKALTTFCDPSCTGGELCGADGQCRPAPASVNVGTVTVRGLATSVEMTPLAPGFNYTNPGTLPHPAFAAGDGIALDSGGGDLEVISLLGAGVEALALSIQSVPLASGAPFDLDWTPMSVAAPTEVKIELNINLHGTSGSRIECTVADTGSFSIPEPLITALVDDGLSGFPAVTLTRSSADSQEVAGGCVDFKVKSELGVDVEIPGLESCSRDEDCTVAGETCQPDLTCG